MASFAVAARPTEPCLDAKIISHIGPQAGFPFSAIGFCEQTKIDEASFSDLCLDVGVDARVRQHEHQLGTELGQQLSHHGRVHRLRQGAISSSCSRHDAEEVRHTLEAPNGRTQV